jgi:hypothetical protein
MGKGFFLGFNLAGFFEIFRIPEILKVTRQHALRTDALLSERVAHF